VRVLPAPMQGAGAGAAAAVGLGVGGGLPGGAVAVPRGYTSARVKRPRRGLLGTGSSWGGLEVLRLGSGGVWGVVGSGGSGLVGACSAKLITGQNGC